MDFKNASLFLSIRVKLKNSLNPLFNFYLIYLLKVI